LNRSNKKSEDGPKQNKDIQAKIVLVIDENNEKLGKMPTYKAIELAQERGLDLVEVAANSELTVCKFTDYGKMMYDRKKKTLKAKKNSTKVTLKEVKFTPSTGQHDFEVKCRNSFKFLEKGDKVKITIRFRGREMAHKDQGEELCNRVLAYMEEKEMPVDIELAPKMDGRFMTMILAPKK
jgi:translation initiation factor IF-3